MNDLVVMLTALDLEYKAVRQTLADVRLQRHPSGTRFEIGRLRNGRCRVAMALVGKGNHPAAVLAERAIAEFAPAAVLFVGIAGALQSKVALGDVVVATHVYAYHGGTSNDDGLKARPRTWEIAHGPDQIARHLARSGDWTRRLPPGAAVPEVRFGPIAAGEIVQDSMVSGHARWVHEHYNDAMAIEMEAAGVAQAGHLNNSLSVIVVRGISDRADGEKTAADKGGWQPRAAASAAAFAVALADRLIADSHDDQSFWGGRTARAAVTGHAELDRPVTNIAAGNARVGVQAGQVFGGIQIASEATATLGLTDQVAGFRERLRQARLADQLDESTYTAAQAELNIVADSLAADGEPATSRLMVALRKLRGLVADVTELAANLSTIIATIKGMS